MSPESLPRFTPAPPALSPRLLPDHPVRVALLDLLAERGTVTATEAASRLGHSSGLCSFHLRQLARYGLIEEAPAVGGRAKPWRLRWAEGPTELEPAAGADAMPEGSFTGLTRELEDESHDRWLGHRDRAPVEWRQQADSFSAVVYLTPGEAAELAADLRARIRAYATRERPAQHPDNAVAVAAISRVFPLLTPDDGRD
ncbi:winged helix-turn-helix domain-containing protein [Streptomyces sp. 8L]|uniref:winged helix-turn-helix domain-containing protein n=1 Tax=Streptomyces sp. 8L TaxID=2877242 RepID=UPI001CD7A072|nr:helix-turn-helix domain-containing protein [Streptomyces sp. 8L]MCA1222461.1 helix-turn-helix domain-containing protein [Streptomyces sp. 8L]